MLGPIKILPVPRYVFVLGVMMLGVTGVGFSQLLEGLQPAKSGTALAVANGLALIAGGLAVIWEQTRKAGGLVMGAIFVLSLLLLQLPLLVASPLQLTSLVAPAECLALALTGGLIAYPRHKTTLPTALRGHAFDIRRCSLVAAWFHSFAHSGMDANPAGLAVADWNGNDFCRVGTDSRQASTTGCRDYCRHVSVVDSASTCQAHYSGPRKRFRMDICCNCHRIGRMFAAGRPRT
jgi:hypothetical protein